MNQDQENIRPTNKIVTTEKPEAEASHTQEFNTKYRFSNRNKGVWNRVLRTHWDISDYFDLCQPVHCHLLRL